MTASSKNTDRNVLIDQMRTAADVFFRAGWLWAHSGNMSCRLDDKTFVITATESHLGDLDDDDFVDIDGDGTPAGDSEQKPSGDADVHLAIYKNIATAGAVYHIHHLEAALCSDRDKKRGFTHLHDVRMIDALDSEGDGLEINIPIVERADVDAFTDALDDADGVPCLNVENHGLYVWGKTPEDARRHVEALAYLFEYSWQRPMNPKKSVSISGF